MTSYMQEKTLFTPSCQLGKVCRQLSSFVVTCRRAARHESPLPCQLGLGASRRRTLMLTTGTASLSPTPQPPYSLPPNPASHSVTGSGLGAAPPLLTGKCKRRQALPDARPSKNLGPPRMGAEVSRPPMLVLASSPAGVPPPRSVHLSAAARMKGPAVGGGGRQGRGIRQDIGAGVLLSTIDTHLRRESTPEAQSSQKSSGTEPSCTHRAQNALNSPLERTPENEVLSSSTDKSRERSAPAPRVASSRSDRESC